MSHRCLGIICGSLLGQGSAYFGQVIGYPPPWTLLDAQVFLGLHGISLGFALDGVPVEGQVVEISMKALSLGVGLIRPSNGETVMVSRAGLKFQSPLIHAMLYREGSWFDPQADETLLRVERPIGLYQVWPVYKIKPPNQGVESWQH